MNLQSKDIQRDRIDRYLRGADCVWIPPLPYGEDRFYKDACIRRRHEIQTTHMDFYHDEHSRLIREHTVAEGCHDRTENIGFSDYQRNRI